MIRRQDRGPVPSGAQARSLVPLPYVHSVLGLPASFRSITASIITWPSLLVSLSFFSSLRTLFLLGLLWSHNPIAYANTFIRTHDIYLPKGITKQVLFHCWPFLLFMCMWMCMFTCVWQYVCVCADVCMHACVHECVFECACVCSAYSTVSS